MLLMTKAVGHQSHGSSRHRTRTKLGHLCVSSSYLWPHYYKSKRLSTRIQILTRYNVLYSCCPDGAQYRTAWTGLRSLTCSPTWSSSQNRFSLLFSCSPCASQKTRIVSNARWALAAECRSLSSSTHCWSCDRIRTLTFRCREAAPERRTTVSSLRTWNWTFA